MSRLRPKQEPAHTEQPTNQYVTNRELAAVLDTVSARFETFNVKLWFAIVFAGGNLATNAIALLVSKPAPAVALLERVLT